MQFEIGKFYKTRQGTKAMYVGKDCNNKVIFAHYNIHEFPSMLSHREDGSYSIYPSGLDIVGEWTEPKTGTVWVNIYGDGGVIVRSSRDEADRIASGCNRIARKKVTWTEGEFDE